MLVLFACNKDKQTNRWLYKDEGRWSVTNHKVVYYENDVIVTSYQYEDGIIVFSKNTRFEWNVDNLSDYIIGTYTATESSIVLKDGSLSKTLNIVSRNKKNMSLEGITITNNGSIISKEVETFTITKK